MPPDDLLIESLPAALLPTATLSGGVWLPPVLLSLLAVSALVASDFHGQRAGRYVFKPLAAAAFVWLALLLGAPGSNYSAWLLAGLLLCLLGDLLLIPDSERGFLAGLGAFLGGHLCYALAFLQLVERQSAVNTTGALLAAPAVLLAALVARWLLPQVPAPMKAPVAVYTLVITAMLVCAGFTLGHPAAPLVLAGAWGFALSDIAVARQQFVRPARGNGLWGTPLYFFSQMVLAASIAWT